MDFAIVTGVTKDYIGQLTKTLPTWKLKPQFANKKIYVITYDCEIDIPDVHIIKWKSNLKNQREIMLNSFLYAPIEHVTEKYFVKLDADAWFTNPDDLFKEEHFKHDLVGQRWGYTKPGIWIKLLDDWAEHNKIDGKAFLKNNSIVNRYFGHRRIISYVCLHSMDFVREVVKLAGPKLPVPSHDTYMWYMANRLPHRKWTYIRCSGVKHSHRVRV